MTDQSTFLHKKADDSPGFLLWKITALWQAKLAGVLAKHGITQTQFAILASLKWLAEQGEKCTQTHIGDHAKIDKMTLSKAIRALEQSGLVQRQASTTDNRAMDVLLRPAGEQLAIAAIKDVEEVDRQFFSSLDENELQLYKSMMQALIEINALAN